MSSSRRCDVFDLMRKVPRNVRDWEGGVNLRDPLTGRCYSFSFGGELGNEVAEGCDDYLYCAIGRMENGRNTDDDGGQLDFNRAGSGYEGDIRRAVADGLEFVGVEGAARERLEYISSFPENFAHCPHLTDGDGGGICSFDGVACYGCRLGRSYRE